MIVNQQVLADCLGISRRRIRQLQQDGILQRGADGYALEECVKAYIDYKINVETGRKASETREGLQAEHERVKIQISKERLRRLRRESLDAKAVEESWADMLTSFKNKLKSLPSKMAMAIAGQDINTSIKIMDDMITDALNDLANYNPDDVEDGDLSEYDDEDDEEDEDSDEGSESW